MKEKKHIETSNRTESKRERIHKNRVRVICMICTVVLCLTSFAACAKNDPTEALSAAVQKIEALESSYEAAQQKIDALESSNAVAQQEIDALKSSNAAAQQEIDALKSINEAARQEIDALKSSNEAAEQEIEQMKEQIKTLEDNITEKIRIYVDQGHNPTGYYNSGATGNGLYEQDLTFLVGYLLAELLEKDTRFEVCLSRPTENTVLGTDNTSSLEARVRGAQEFDADYFISLHTNAADTEDANGIEVLVASNGGISYAFGTKLLEELIDSTGLSDRGMKLRPELHVLKNATMPAVLVEMGFITNAEDAAMLSQSPALFAQGIYAGILEYFGLSPYNAPTAGN